MDITTIIIGIIIILCAALPIILTNYFRKRREKLALQGIQNLAEKSGEELENYEIGMVFSIGMDKSHRNLYFSRLGESALQVQLSKIKNSTTINKSHDIKTAEGNHSVIDLIGIQINMKDEAQTPAILEFFNAEKDSISVDNESHIAEQWSRLINKQVGNSASKR